MDLALRLGRRGAGCTAENPAVGCVIVRHTNQGSHLVGHGWTQAGGRPHAERVALQEAGERARGATAYVTLEPCSHHGKTPPCADALIAAGIKRVICAHEDPDPRVAGKGFAMLRNVGIEVETGLLRGRARRDLAGFLSRIERQRPWLQVKMAFSPDGMIGRPGGGNVAITGPEAKARTFALRAMADAVLVGVETVIVDDPGLDVRLPGLEDRSPLRVVLDSTGRMPLDNRLVQTARTNPVWIVTTDEMSADKASALEEQGCRVLTVGKGPDGRVDLADALKSLAVQGINTVFAECGATLSEALLQADLVDECLIYRGARTVGPDGLVALGGDAHARLLVDGFVADRSEQMGKDRLQVYIKPQSIESLDGRMS